MTTNIHEEINQKPIRPSKWEWIPPLLVALFALLYFKVATPGSGLSRFSICLGLALIPGTIWRLAGHRSWNVHRLCFAAGLVVFVFNNPELRPDKSSLAKIAANWHYVLAGCLISAAQPLWGMWRTERLLTDSGVVLSHYDSFKLCLAGSFFNIFLPGATGGDAYRVYVITHGYKTKLMPAIASITLDRILSLPALILVLLIGMILDYNFFRSNRVLSGMIPLVSGAAAICLALVAYLLFAGKARRRENWTHAYMPEDGARPGWLKRTHAMIATNVKRKSTLPVTLMQGVLSHVFCILACLCFGLALGVENVPPLRYFLIVPMVMTINSLPGAPGGVGQGELAMATFLQIASPGSANAQDGVMIMLLFRISNMIMGLVGGVYYGLGRLDFSGIDHISQGLTRILRRDSTRIEAFPSRLSEEYERVKSESVRLYYDKKNRSSRRVNTTVIRRPAQPRMVFDTDHNSEHRPDQRPDFGRHDDDTETFKFLEDELPPR